MPKYTDHLPCDWPFLKKFRTGTDQLKLPSSVEASGVAGVPRNQSQETEQRVLLLRGIRAALHPQRRLVTFAM